MCPGCHVHALAWPPGSRFLDLTFRDVKACFANEAPAIKVQTLPPSICSRCVGRANPASRAGAGAWAGTRIGTQKVIPTPDFRVSPGGRQTQENKDLPGGRNWGVGTSVGLLGEGVPARSVRIQYSRFSLLRVDCYSLICTRLHQFCELLRVVSSSRLPEVIFETATAPELRQNLLHNTPLRAAAVYIIGLPINTSSEFPRPTNHRNAEIKVRNISQALWRVCFNVEIEVRDILQALPRAASLGSSGMWCLRMWCLIIIVL